MTLGVFIAYSKRNSLSINVQLASGGSGIIFILRVSTNISIEPCCTPGAYANFLQNTVHKPF